MKRKSVWLVTGLAAVLLVAGGVFVLGRDGDDTPSQEERSQKRQLISRVRKPSVKKADGKLKAKRDRKRNKDKKGKKAKKPKHALPESVVAMMEKEIPELEIPQDDFERYSAVEKKLFNDIKRALSDNDRKSLVRLASQAQSSGQRGIRSAAVDALGWVGKDAIPELAAFAADADREIASEAMDNLVSALQESDPNLSDLENDIATAASLEQLMKAVSDSVELDALAMTYHTLDDKVAIESLQRVIDGGGKAADVAKETYSFVTGEDYVSAEAAKAWVKENYVSPYEESADLADPADAAEGQAAQPVQ